MLAVEKWPKTPPCDIYGVEHLLRLFVKLPGLLDRTLLSGKELSLIQVELLFWTWTHGV